MRVMEFSEETKVDFVRPDWADFMGEDDFISYMPSYTRGLYLDWFEEKLYKNEGQNAPYDTMTYYLFNPLTKGADPAKKYPLLIFLHGATNALDGRICIGHSGGEMFASPEYQKKMGGGAFVLAPLANEKRDKNGNLADSWDHHYIPLIKKVIDQTISEYPENISDIFILGGSSGGYMTWEMIRTYPDFFTGAMPASTDNVPPSESLKELHKNQVNIFFPVARHDEFGCFSEKLTSRMDELNSYDNITCFFPEWIRNGDKGIASLFFGIEMGQHCIITQMQADLIYEDGTPYCEALPEGVTGWIKSLLK